jgi:hypothetical protein
VILLIRSACVSSLPVKLRTTYVDFASRSPLSVLKVVC